MLFNKNHEKAICDTVIEAQTAEAFREEHTFS